MKNMAETRAWVATSHLSTMGWFTDLLCQGGSPELKDDGRGLHRHVGERCDVLEAVVVVLGRLPAIQRVDLILEAGSCHVMSARFLGKFPAKKAMQVFEPLRGTTWLLENKADGLRKQQHSLAQPVEKGFQESHA
jgi:hypothetical protein